MSIVLEGCPDEDCRFDPEVHKGDRFAALVLYFDEDAMGICKHHALHIGDMDAAKVITTAKILQELAHQLIDVAWQKDPETVQAIATNMLTEALMRTVEPRIDPEEAH